MTDYRFGVGDEEYAVDSSGRGRAGVIVTFYDAETGGSVVTQQTTGTGGFWPEFTAGVGTLWAEIGGSARRAVTSPDYLDAVAAVPATNDTIIAGRINDPASATSGALTATYVGKASPPSGGDDTAYLQSLMNAHPSVILSDGDYQVTNLTWPQSLVSLRGTTNTRLIHATGATGALLSQQNTSQRVTRFSMRDILIRGNTGAGETYGIDWSGFSYGSVSNVHVSNFTLDGMFAQGDITPTNRQVSNITFAGCSAKLNSRHGLNLAVGAGQANTACTWAGFEASGNGGDGVHIDEGTTLTFYGATLQGNTGYDLFCDGGQNVFSGTYFEHATSGVSIALGANSQGNTLDIKHLSYSLAVSLSDLGSGNEVTHPNQADGRDLFNNTALDKQTSIFVPKGMAKIGTSTFAISTDAAAPQRFTVRVPITTNFQGFSITLDDATYDQMAGRWVTVVMNAKNDAPAATTLRVYAEGSDGSTNSTNGEFVLLSNVSTGGKYLRKHYDVRVPAAATGSGKVKLRVYLVYDGVAGTVTWDVAEVRVLNGVAYTGNHSVMPRPTRDPELAAAPTSGTWAVGEKVRNAAPAVGSPKGWVCTVAGTPGTWVSEGNL